MIKKILTIAGSDSSGGAGIQADIKTITAHKMYAMSAITAITAQNTTGVFGITDISSDFVAKQLDCIFTDIFPDAVKIGMVANSETIRVIVQKLMHYNARNIVIDPVMVSTSEHSLLPEDAQASLVNLLLPIGNVITPNIPESESLCGFKINSETDLIAAGKYIEKHTGCATLIKGGHLKNDATDFLFENNSVKRFNSKRIITPNSHGTGCTLSSAIACNLASGMTLAQSIFNAKKYITGALSTSLNLGKGSGPVNHMFMD